jgi:hypothetical protein
MMPINPSAPGAAANQQHVPPQQQQQQQQQPQQEQYLQIRTCTWLDGRAFNRLDLV